MLLNASGYVSSEILTKAILRANKDRSPMSLPMCVDFDSVYEKHISSLYVRRNNVDNVTENTFYVTTPKQALINQSKLDRLPKEGSYFSILPGRNLDVEGMTCYSTELCVELIDIGHNAMPQIVSEIKSFILSLGVPRKCLDFVIAEKEGEGVEVWINLIKVGNVICFDTPNGITITVGTLAKEPLLSYAVEVATI